MKLIVYTSNTRQRTSLPSDILYVSVLRKNFSLVRVSKEVYQAITRVYPRMLFLPGNRQVYAELSSGEHATVFPLTNVIPIVERRMRSYDAERVSRHLLYIRDTVLEMENEQA